MTDFVYVVVDFESIFDPVNVFDTEEAAHTYADPRDLLVYEEPLLDQEFANSVTPDS